MSDWLFKRLLFPTRHYSVLHNRWRGSETPLYPTHYHQRYQQYPQVTTVSTPAHNRLLIIGRREGVGVKYLLPGSYYFLRQFDFIYVDELILIRNIIKQMCIGYTSILLLEIRSPITIVFDTKWIGNYNSRDRLW